MDIKDATNKDIAEELFRRGVNHFIVIDNNDGSHMQSSRGSPLRVALMLKIAIEDIFRDGQQVNAEGLEAMKRIEGQG